MVLDLDTAYLYHCDNKHSRGKTCTVLNPRCVSCSAQKGFTRFLTQHGLLCEPDQKHCRHRACLRPPFAGSLFCDTHLFRCVRDVPDHVGSTAVTRNSVPLDLLQETLKKALSRRWPFSRSQNVPRNKAGVPGNASPIPRNTKRIPRNLQISCNGGLEFCNLHKKSEEGTSCGPHFSVVLVT